MEVASNTVTFQFPSLAFSCCLAQFRQPLLMQVGSGIWPAAVWASYSLDAGTFGLPSAAQGDRGWELLGGNRDRNRYQVTARGWPAGWGSLLPLLLVVVVGKWGHKSQHLLPLYHPPTPPHLPLWRNATPGPGLLKSSHVMQLVSLWNAEHPFLQRKWINICAHGPHLCMRVFFVGLEPLELCDTLPKFANFCSNSGDHQGGFFSALFLVLERSA